MEWITNHWVEIGAAAGLVMAATRAIVKLTPTPSDDAWYAKIVGFLKNLGLHINDSDTPTPPTGAGTASLLLLALLFLPMAGCAAAATVREGQAVEDVTWQNYIRNTGRIHDLTLTVYQTERAKGVEYTTTKAMEKVRAAAVDGKLPVADFEGAVKAVVEEREKATAETAATAARIRTLIASNNEEAAKALRIHGKMTEWLAAGMDESAVAALIDEAVTVIQAATPKAASPPGK